MTPTVSVTPTVTSTPTVTDTPTVKPTASVTPTPGVTTSPTVPPTPVPTPGTPTPGTPTPTPKDTGSKDGYPNVEGKRGVLGEKEYLRPAVGRNQERQVTLPKKTKLVIVDTIKSEFNEIWYKVAVLLDGKVKYGYLQASAVDLEGYPTPGSSASMTRVGVGNYDVKHGKDRDGDGVYVVVLDAGHGGPFHGACHFGAREKDMNLEVAKACKKYLEDNYENVRVYLTRDGDSVFDSNNDVDDLEYRVRYAMSKKADILVSMHFDANLGTERGAEALITKGKLMDKSKALGSQILRELGELGINTSTYGCMTRVSARSRYSYPDGTKMDGYLIVRLAAEQGIVPCIIEHVHMDNKKDFNNFCDTKSKREKLGQADARGIASYLGLKKKTASATPTPTLSPEAQPTGTATATPTAEPEVTLSVTPKGEALPTPVAGEPETSPTPVAGEPEASPTPVSGEPEATPTPVSGDNGETTDSEGDEAP